MNGFFLTFYPEHEHTGPFLKYTGTAKQIFPSLIDDYGFDGDEPYIVEIDVFNGTVYGLPGKDGGESYLEGPFKLDQIEAIELIERCSP